MIQRQIWTLAKKGSQTEIPKGPKNWTWFLEGTQSHTGKWVLSQNPMRSEQVEHKHRGVSREQASLSLLKGGLALF